MIITFTQTFLILISLNLSNAAKCALSLPPNQFGQDGWNYANTENWGTIQDGKYPFCSGTSQSPINIITDSVESGGPNVFIQQGVPTQIELERLPYTLEGVGDYISNLFVTDKSDKTAFYRSVQFHLHTPSEHQINGESFDLEIHFVHFIDQLQCEEVTNQITVLGLLVKIDESSNNPFFKTWVEAEDKEEVSNFSIFSNFLSLINLEAKGYQYSGSLTTPPCKETVNWVVLDTPIKVSQFQFNKIISYFSNRQLFPTQNNNRPVQDLNGRKIQEIKLIQIDIKQITLIQSDSQTLYNEENTDDKAAIGELLTIVLTFIGIMLI